MENTMNETCMQKLKYLSLLSESFPDTNKACTEIINLQAILNLPKGTEHFVSDIHGEYHAFNHVLRNASGVIKDYIQEIFETTLREADKRNLSTLICYPELKIEDMCKKETDLDDWYRISLFRLLRVCKRICYKYTRSKVRKALPPEYAYILEELIHEDANTMHKQQYYNEIIDSILRLGKAADFITALCKVIQRLSIDHLHVIGDIFDRGENADKVLDILSHYHSVDVQWGNHDIYWMGAACGSAACICNVIRISARYANLHTIEEGYGINLVPLATFAMEHYNEDDCTAFIPEPISASAMTEKEKNLVAKIHKAITMIQFKVEAAVIQRNPEFEMADRLLLDQIDYERHTIQIEGKEYPLTDVFFPTIDPQNPFQLTEEEAEIMEKIIFSFKNSGKLQNHIRFLFNKGSMYTIFNQNLLFHGCVPMNAQGHLKNVSIGNKKYSGKKLLDTLDAVVRKAYSPHATVAERQKGLDTMWYLWCGKDSPLYGKNKMTTFERYFIADAGTYHEEKNPYYTHRDRKECIERILNSFGMDVRKSHVINGHVPVQVSHGENPVKAEGKLIVIDGGFTKAYQSVTGIAGYTLIFNSKGLNLVSHEPFDSLEKAIQKDEDIISSMRYIERNDNPIKVNNTDIGEKIKKRIKELEDLVAMYKQGFIKE